MAGPSSSAFNEILDAGFHPRDAGFDTDSKKRYKVVVILTEKNMATT